MISRLLTRPATLLERYNQSLIRTPYRTKGLTSATTYFIGDLVCQFLIEKQTLEEYSFKRSIRQAAIGLFFTGPSLHIWHSFALPGMVKGIVNKYKKIFCSVVLNEILLGGYFVFTLLFGFEALRKRSITAGIENVKKKFTFTMISSVKFWTTISFINYAFLPIHIRPAFTSIWSIAWQSYFSLVSNNFLKNNEQIIVEKDAMLRGDEDLRIGEIEGM